MNKAFKVLWNDARRSFVVLADTLNWGTTDKEIKPI